MKDIRLGIVGLGRLGSIHAENILNKIKGGKLIGEGSSTCVFRPNLPCKNKNIKIDDKHVSKLVAQSEGITTPDWILYKDNKFSKQKL